MLRCWRACIRKNLLTLKSFACRARAGSRTLEIPGRPGSSYPRRGSTRDLELEASSRYRGQSQPFGCYFEKIITLKYFCLMKEERDGSVRPSRFRFSEELLPLPRYPLTQASPGTRNTGTCAASPQHRNVSFSPPPTIRKISLT
jgi:hypothetical protein